MLTVNNYFKKGRGISTVIMMGKLLKTVYVFHGAAPVFVLNSLGVTRRVDERCTPF